MGDFFDFENFSNSGQSRTSANALIRIHQYLKLHNCDYTVNILCEGVI